MPLYEPLREGFRDLSNMMRDGQIFNAQQQNIRAAQQRQGELDQSELNFKLAAEERAAKGRAIWGESVRNELAGDTFTDLTQRVKEIPMEIESLKRDIAGMKGAPATAPARLGAKTLMAALNAELAQKRGQLANPTWMANQYHTKAKNLVQRSGELAPFDLQGAGLLTQHANIALNQGDKFLAQAKMQAAAKKESSGSRDPARKMAVVVDPTTGEAVQMEDVFYPKTTGQGQTALEAAPELNKYTQQKNKQGKNLLVMWKDQFDATYGAAGAGDRKGKDVHFNAVKNLYVAILGHSSEFAATEEQAALLNFSRRRLASEQEFLEAKLQRPLTEAEAGVLISQVFKHHREKHNQFLKESRGVNPRFKSPEDTKKTGELPGLAQIKQLLATKKISKKTAEAIKDAWHKNGLEIFGYPVTHDFITQARELDTERRKQDWEQ